MDSLYRHFGLPRFAQMHQVWVVLFPTYINMHIYTLSSISIQRKMAPVSNSWRSFDFLSNEHACWLWLILLEIRQMTKTFRLEMCNDWVKDVSIKPVKFAELDLSVHRISASRSATSVKADALHTTNISKEAFRKFLCKGWRPCFKYHQNRSVTFIS